MGIDFINRFKTGSIFITMLGAVIQILEGLVVLLSFSFLQPRWSYYYACWYLNSNFSKGDNNEIM